MKTLSAVILAAGSSCRMGKDKQQILLDHKPVWMHSVITFGLMPETLEIIVVTGAERIAVMQAQLTEYKVEPSIVQKISFVVGGDCRMASAANGVRSCQADSAYFAVHDGARPLVDAADIRKALDALEECDAVSLGVYVKDTIKQVDANQTVISTPDRSNLMITQTPQIIQKKLYLDALAQAEEKGFSPTDDCQLIESYGVPVRMVCGSYQNMKITTPEDVPAAEAMIGQMKERTEMDIRVGHGYDVHRFAPERDLILGGVKVPYELGLLGHSDADVLVHAVMDALLGAAALGDIGKHFPDTDPTYKGADSMKLLTRVVELLREQQYRISNIDATVIAQKPKLAQFIPQMKENIAKVCGIPLDRVNVKATTEEKLGFTGRLEGISAHAVCALLR